MTIVELNEMLKGIAGATMVRANKTNFIAVPCEDGVAKISVVTALASDTKTHKAFNLEAAVAEYKAWEADAARREAERAAKPPRVVGPNPEAQARRDELDAKITALPAFEKATATDIYNMLTGQIAENVTVMAVGQAAHRLVDKGVLTVEADEKKKSFYTKA